MTLPLSLEHPFPAQLIAVVAEFAVLSLSFFGSCRSHFRFITSTGAAVNFMHVQSQDPNETVFQYSKTLEQLSELHSTTNNDVLFVSEPHTIAALCCQWRAQNIERLRFPLSEDRVPVRNPCLWTNNLVSLRSMKELRIEGAPDPHIWTYELARSTGSSS
ncbi:hypothetical protein AURDEDRAFT_173159 [Auricularia subglabra TFB-10046 SS5]|nr:hypothetical protein AURDEDRAFT_173159 [Auricularia subglabra TFB-10046 SS5]